MIKNSLSLVSLSAGLMLGVLVAISLVTGVSQQAFELFMNPTEYGAKLTTEATPLRLILGLDNIFIALYVSGVLLLIQRLNTKGNSGILPTVIAVCVLLAGLLDYLENFHILTMLTIAEQGIELNQAAIEGQVILSMLKWHLAYFAFFVLAFVIAAKSLSAKFFRFALLYIQMPVGIFYYITYETTTGDLFFYSRYLNLVVGFFLIAFFFWKRERGLKGSTS